MRPGLLLAALAALALPGCATVSAQDAIATERLPVPAQVDAQGRIGELVWGGGLRLSGLGGISAIDITPDGSTLTLLTDRTQVGVVRPVTDEAGELVGLETLRRHPLLDADGRPYIGGFNDSEGLAMLPMGWRVVSFEYHHRLMVFDPGLTREEGEIPLPRDAVFDRNQGIEAITETPDGRLLILSERDGPVEAGLHQGWVGGADGWEGFAYRPQPGHRPTGADLLPNGDIIVIERRDPFLATMGGAIVHVPWSAIAAGAVVEGRVLARLQGDLWDNYEGITAWRDPEGRIRILVASDDNEMFLLRGVLLQFFWTP